MDDYKNLPINNFGRKIRSDFGNKTLSGLIFGNFGSYNIGDEAILSGELEELERNNIRNIKVIARYPEEIYRLYRLPGIRMFDIFSVLSALYISDFVIFGGGGLFCKNNAGIKGIIFQLYGLMLIFVSKLSRKKLYIIGLGFYENAPKIITVLGFFVLKLADELAVRDFYTYHFLRSKNIKSGLYKDNSFLMSLPPLKSVSYPGKKINIGVALKRPESQKEIIQLDSEIGEFIKNHKEAYFWFYTLDNHPQYSTDNNFIKSIVNKYLYNSKSFHFIPNTWTPQQVFSSFKQMDFFIAMRLHSMIFCYRLNIPFYAITYDRKCATFLDSIGHTSHSIHDTTAREIEKDMQPAIKKDNYYYGKKQKADNFAFL
ncbi:MAG: polysaccharide pyruvyl transferase CsaB [Candidatus Gottesmanbacteria bacterium GW2011_GWC2_39_8]|uniref:Polysaccharide pyruvyl transferase CsaB n=1 Tax=Candidatus Gottesmanbacteria bacterium GW2011_GWC2_39_8 TaxID=1618450 RepID=A0A0G0T653_9BACT|nr:MAG: polysaccharide pyruvyl transferase CsaB [Candidatus Gottesmanbacteria bacterium GW2011_GWC2_39_8]